MDAKFFEEVQAVVGPTLSERGFVLDEIDDGVDEGGRSRQVLYYRSTDCKIQIYQSSREGEVNCMIAPLRAPNKFGLQADNWQYLSRFSDRPDLPLPEIIRLTKTEFESYRDPLEWVRSRITKYFEAAREGILEMYKDN